MRFLISILLLLFPIGACGAKIVVSTNHIASIVSMVTDDVEVIASCSSCPKHYSLKPSDVEKIESADLVIYIDDKFEPFAEVLKVKTKGKLIKISDFDNVDIRSGNYHIWLDIDVAKKILSTISKEFDIKNDDAIDGLKTLSEYRDEVLGKVKHPVILSASLEYLFDSPEKLYRDLGKVNLISKIEGLSEDATIFGDSNGNFAYIEEKTGRKVTLLDSDKWPKIDYISYYRNILDKVAQNGSVQNTAHK